MIIKHILVISIWALQHIICVMYILNYNVTLSSVTRQAISINVTFRHVHITTIAVEKQYYIFWVRVCSFHYPAWNAHVPYYIVICGLFGSTIFFHIIAWTAQFSEKRYWTKNLFWFSLRLSKTLLILWRTQLDIIKKVHW